MTSTELANIKTLDYNQIAALTGADTQTSTILPRLKINRDPDFPMGEYCVSQEGHSVYSKVARFRPFINAYQYQEYNPEANQFVNRSIIFKNFNEEPHDELGGLACGKVKRDLWDKLEPNEQLRQRNIKCNRLMYGTLSFPEGEVENLPVMFKLSGSNFMTPKDALAAITKARHQYFNHMLELTTKKQKQGSTVYYEVLVQPILKDFIEFTDEDMDTFSLLQETIDRENSFVMNKWKAVKKSQVKEDDKALLKTLELNDDIPDL